VGVAFSEGRKEEGSGEALEIFGPFYILTYYLILSFIIKYNRVTAQASVRHLPLELSKNATRIPYLLPVIELNEVAKRSTLTGKQSN
jgi:hypothetical protein